VRVREVGSIKRSFEIPRDRSLTTGPAVRWQTGVVRDTAHLRCPVLQPRCGKRVVGKRLQDRVLWYFLSQKNRYRWVGGSLPGTKRNKGKGRLLAEFKRIFRVGFVVLKNAGGRSFRRGAHSVNKDKQFPLCDAPTRLSGSQEKIGFQGDYGPDVKS